MTKEPVDAKYREAFYFMCGFMWPHVKYGTTVNIKKMMQKAYDHYGVLPADSVIEAFEIKTKDHEQA